MVGDYEDFRRMHDKIKHQLFTKRKREMKSGISVIVGNKSKLYHKKGLKSLFLVFRFGIKPWPRTWFIMCCLTRYMGRSYGKVFLGD
jgi:hypothetical protein